MTSPGSAYNGKPIRGTAKRTKHVAYYSRSTIFGMAQSMHPSKTSHLHDPSEPMISLPVPPIHRTTVAFPQDQRMQWAVFGIMTVRTVGSLTPHRATERGPENLQPITWTVWRLVRVGSLRRAGRDDKVSWRKHLVIHKVMTLGPLKRFVV